MSTPNPRRSTHPAIAVVGATGAVGVEFLQVLEQRNFPLSSIRLLASPRSAGKTMKFRGQDITVEALTDKSFEGIDIALFSAGGSISKQYGPIAVTAGAIVVDNSSAFRQTAEVPLVVPEVNPEHIGNIGLKPGQKAGIIANPNCSTILMVTAMTALHRAANIRRLVISTYQAASGAGAQAMEELKTQTQDVLEGKPAKPVIFAQQYAFNLFSHNAPIVANGYNEEEMKMVKETHKIWGQDSLPMEERTQITATCIRVPIMRAHAESVNATFEKPMSEAQAKALLEKAPGVSIIDDRAANRFPMPLDAQHQDDIYVGRIRRDISQPEGKGIDLFLCGDQIRKGAALNAVQIAELLLAK